jgi:hypothetical protein
MSTMVPCLKVSMSYRLGENPGHTRLRQTCWTFLWLYNQGNTFQIITDEVAKGFCGCFEINRTPYWVAEKKHEDCPQTCSQTLTRSAAERTLLQVGNCLG